ncbi:hypothetical protein SERLA73DRAFT_148999 [Serpula lacrymans var. lacrymans S7.3]|uniref:Uncharacterized protein n=1 Tax=Serpula lacrymans var. lacrymans (strain S7.3) TaxID=936435 RepID=F8PHJ9_SERL3|nr:hypothetical protein SERLA73DRAFT_148999 [Serpula lacrymans var. lacrymans S7.3]
MLSVPFSKETPVFGPQVYVVPNYHYHNPVAIIHKNLEEKINFEKFHLLQFWSNLTYLTSFGNAKLWPLYFWFGNKSKYCCCKPSSKLCKHIAYSQTLPDSFKDWVIERTDGKIPFTAFMKHCQHEFFHAQWYILFDVKFKEAYKHSIMHLSARKDNTSLMYDVYKLCPKKTGIFGTKSGFCCMYLLIGHSAHTTLEEFAESKLTFKQLETMITHLTKLKKANKQDM